MNKIKRGHLVRAYPRFFLHAVGFCRLPTFAYSAHILPIQLAQPSPRRIQPGRHHCRAHVGFRTPGGWRRIDRGQKLLQHAQRSQRLSNAQHFFHYRLPNRATRKCAITCELPTLARGLGIQRIARIVHCVSNRDMIFSVFPGSQNRGKVVHLELDLVCTPFKLYFRRRL